MIQMETMLQVADNSGARKVKCFKVLGGSKKQFATVGDMVRVSVREALPDSKVKKGSKFLAVIVRTAQPVKRADGSVIRFDENAAVLVKGGNETTEPIGTRIFGPVAREVRQKGFVRIASLAPEVL